MREKRVIVSAARTAIGKAPRGALRNVHTADLAATAIKAALERAPGLDPKEIDDVILGCAMPEAEQGLNCARGAAAGRPAQRRAGADDQPILRLGVADNRAGGAAGCWPAWAMQSWPAGPEHEAWCRCRATTSRLTQHRPLNTRLFIWHGPDRRECGE